MLVVTILDFPLDAHLFQRAFAGERLLLIQEAHLLHESTLPESVIVQVDVAFLILIVFLQLLHDKDMVTLDILHLHFGALIVPFELQGGQLLLVFLIFG